MKHLLSVILVMMFALGAKASCVMDTVEHWQVYVNDKLILKGNAATGNEGKQTIVLDKDDVITIYHRYCTFSSSMYNYIAINGEKCGRTGAAHAEIKGSREPVRIPADLFYSQMQESSVTEDKFKFSFYEQHDLTLEKVIPKHENDREDTAHLLFELTIRIK